LIGFWGEVGNILALSRVIGFFPFFMLGYMIEERDFKEFVAKRRPLHAFFGFGLLAVSLYCGWQLSLLQLSFSDLAFFPYESPYSVILRVISMLIAFVMIISLSLMLPGKHIRFLTSWGQNSLSIYVLHRYIPLIFASLFPYRKDAVLILACSLFGSILTIGLLGFHAITRQLGKLLELLEISFSGPQNRRHKLVRLAFMLFLLFHFVLGMTLESRPKEESEPVYPVISSYMLEKIRNAVSIGFVGDLILLRDQVKAAYNNETKDFDFEPQFKYAKKYLSAADFAIGVLEGPMAGEDKGFSTSNYDDGIPLYLNFPDSFADSIKNSGIDMVTLANNHLLDKGLEGVMRTMDVLNEKELSYVGAYRNLQEKKSVKIISVKGLRLAVLAYTFPSNYYKEDYFFTDNSWVTSILVPESSPHFSDALTQVRSDFARAKAENPDFIVVLPHMGTQFIHTTDDFQQTWNEIFIEAGADIILGDHAHAVQPVEFRSILRNGNARHAVIVNCPGNFVNSYNEKNGDATSIVKVYLDPDSKAVLAAGIIPMWTHVSGIGMPRALPVHDIVSDASLTRELSLPDMRRVKEVLELVSGVMLGEKLTLDQSQEVYYLLPDGYYRQPVAGLELDSAAKESELYVLFERSKSVLFIGDSITLGSKNGGYGWFEPLIRSLPNLSFSQAAWGGATSRTLMQNSEKICSHTAELYVVAIGTNDIRYRDPKICAMTPEQFVENIDRLVADILKSNPTASFIFVAPWPSLPNDPFTPIPFDHRKRMFSEYTDYLHTYCRDKGYLFSDPGAAILSSIDMKVAGHHLLDHIHPNASSGISLYSRAFIMSGAK
jgi:hypothetical protein